MATSNAVAAVGLAIRGLLTDAAAGEFPAARFDLARVSDIQKEAQGLGVSICLYRVAATTTPRNMRPRLDPNGRRFRPPLPLDLYYALVPWGSTAESQHRLLVWAMREIENTPVLPAALLNQGERNETFRADETVDLVFDPLSLADLANVWDVFDPKGQLVATYVVRQVLIESDIPLDEATIVQTRDFGYAPLNPGDIQP
jgi:Pvc16 N-terminal domain